MQVSYKGYHANAEWDEEDALFSGKIEGIRDLVTFHSFTKEDVEPQFRAAVDDYLLFRKSVGKTPETEQNVKHIGD